MYWEATLLVKCDMSKSNKDWKSCESTLSESALCTELEPTAAEFLAITWQPPLTEPSAPGSSGSVSVRPWSIVRKFSESKPSDIVWSPTSTDSGTRETDRVLQVAERCTLCRPDEVEFAVAQSALADDLGWVIRLSQVGLQLPPTSAETTPSAAARWQREVFATDVTKELPEFRIWAWVMFVIGRERGRRPSAEEFSETSQ